MTYVLIMFTCSHCELRAAAAAAAAAALHQGRCQMRHRLKPPGHRLLPSSLPRRQLQPPRLALTRPPPLQLLQVK